MSLIKCKECGKEISTKADACPHCGAKPYKPGGCMIVFLVAAGLFGFISLVGDYKHNQASPPMGRSLPPVFEPEVTARGLCMLQIKSQLHDPSSAEFESSATTTVKHDGEIWTVVRPVRAKNAMNATRRALFECRYRLTGQDLTLLGIRQLDQ